MDIARFARKTKQVVSDNTPAILTVVGIAGTVASTVLAGRAGYKSGYKIATEDLVGLGMITQVDQERLKEGVKVPHQDDRNKYVAKTTWKLYLPSAITGVGTIASIAAAHRIGTNRTAALAAAYTITDRAFSEYKSKVVENLGEKKEKTEIQDKIMQDRMDKSGDRSNLVVVSNNDVLCYDAFTDRYFQSSMEALKKAQNDTNYEILHNMYVSLSEFYDRVGLAHTGFSDEIGWNSDNKLDLQFSSVMTPDQRPALAFSFRVDPVRTFDRAHA